MSRKNEKQYTVEHVHVNSVAEAWIAADKIIPNDYERDDGASVRAGYPIYRSTYEYLDYICDLCTRLEINLHDGRTVNIWIDEPEAEPVEAPAELAPVAEVKSSGRYYTVYGADLEPVGVVKASSVAEAMKKAGRGRRKQMITTYSLYVSGERCGWRFRSLWAARLVASDAAAAAGMEVHVIDDSTGAVMFSFTRDGAGRTRCTYADADALQELRRGAIVEKPAAAAGV